MTRNIIFSLKKSFSDKYVELLRDKTFFKKSLLIILELDI